MVFNTNDILYPDSVVGTDSHTTMIDGLGVAGWGVGGIEAEAAMLGQVVGSPFPVVCSYTKDWNVSGYSILLNCWVYGIWIFLVCY